MQNEITNGNQSLFILLSLSPISLFYDLIWIRLPEEIGWTEPDDVDIGAVVKLHVDSSVPSTQSVIPLQTME